MYLIVGLGNPGREYVNTRHNIGFMAVDLLSERWNIPVCREARRALFGEGRACNARVTLAKPLTYMNNSGWSVRDMVNWYKCEPNELVVVYDDIDLPLGDIRVRAQGSSGTHNGMRSIIYQLGFDDFPRVRIGIGRGDNRVKLAGHVLSEPTGEEREALLAALKNAADAVEMIVKGNLLEAQARFNKKKPKPQKTEEEKEAAELIHAANPVEHEADGATE